MYIYVCIYTYINIHIYIHISSMILTSTNYKAEDETRHRTEVRYNQLQSVAVRIISCYLYI